MITDFNIPKEDADLIGKIVARAKKELQVQDTKSLDMDITACHKYDGPLNLQKLLDSDYGDFGHDVHGISRYIDRCSGVLTRCFCPRCGRAPDPDSLRATAEPLLNALRALVEANLSSKGSKEEDCQRLTLLNRISAVDHAFNGVEAEDMTPSP